MARFVNGNLVTDPDEIQRGLEDELARLVGMSEAEIQAEQEDSDPDFEAWEPCLLPVNSLTSPPKAASAAAQGG